MKSARMCCHKIKKPWLSHILSIGYLKIHNKSWVGRLEEGEITESQLMIENYAGVTSSVVMRSNVFERTQGFNSDMPARQDYLMWLKIAKYGPLVATPKIGLDWITAEHRVLLATDDMGDLKIIQKLTNYKVLSLMN